MSDTHPVLDLEAMGRQYLKRVRRNLPTARLYEEIVKNREGQIAHAGPVVVRTGRRYTELPPQDRFIVKGPVSEEKVYWKRHQVMSEYHFEGLVARIISYMQNREVYVQNVYACNDCDDCRIPIRIVTESAWHSLFARKMFTPEYDPEVFNNFSPAFSVVHIPGFHAKPETDGTHSHAFALINMEQKIAAIAGTAHAGEIRHAVFSFVNYLLPHEAVLPMRCAVNIGKAGDTAVFIGREGSGKTTLSLDSERILIGDHEHGWSDKGLFCFERGGYARVLNLSEKEEPLLFDLTRKFGTILENVAMDPDTRRIDLSDGILTQNTRAAYSISHIPHAAERKVCGHPKNLFLLTCDAFGVMPPISRLTPEQTLYGFLSGYTSRSIHAESGEVELTSEFDMNFGASSLTLPPAAYSGRLLEKIRKHNVRCWLVNTGWIGDPHGKASRIPIEYSRALIRAVLSGQMETVGYETDPVFQFEIPKECPGLPARLLNPRTAASDPGEYEMRANRLAQAFTEAFEQFKDEMPDTMQDMLSGLLSIEKSFDFMDDFGFSL